MRPAVSRGIPRYLAVSRGIPRYPAVSPGIARHRAVFQHSWTKGKEGAEGGGKWEKEVGKTPRVYCAQNVSGLGLTSVPLECDFGVI